MSLMHGSKRNVSPDDSKPSVILHKKQIQNLNADLKTVMQHNYNIILICICLSTNTILLSCTKLVHQLNIYMDRLIFIIHVLIKYTFTHLIFLNMPCLTCSIL